jgi:hypothetical protein
MPLGTVVDPKSGGQVDAEGIFLIQGAELTVLVDQPYESEDMLQRALADFPAVLAGGATTGEVGRRLLLIRREKGIPTTELGTATFSVDHLFVDPDGVPVVVEVKRSSDTRIRREVVGQMLDYAANGVKYWPISDLRADFEHHALDLGIEPATLIEELAPGRDPEDFWSDVERNLRSGHVRMVFVADRLPAELVRIIEFLNEQMSPAEVLGVEVQQFTDGTTSVLVPRTIGATAAAKAVKDRGSGTPWNAATFLAAAAERGSKHDVEVLEYLLNHAEQRGSKLSWGKGVTPGVSGWYPVGDTSRAVWTTNAGTGTGSSKAYIYLYLPELRDLLTDTAYDSFIQAMTQIPAFATEFSSGKRKYPSVYLDTLTKADLPVLANAVEQLAGSPSSAPTHVE